MNPDFRISVEFLDHPKTLELEDRLGAAAVISLLRIWSYCATQSIEGYLPNSHKRIAQIAGWDGKPGEFIYQLTRLKLLDHIEDEYRVHDWAEHQPFAIGAKDRIESARKAGKASAKSRRKKNGTAQPLGGRGFEASRTDVPLTLSKNRTTRSVEPNPQPNPR